MDHGKLVRRAFEIAWQYKSLWLFGLFAAGGVTTLNFDLNSGDLGITPETTWPFVQIRHEILVSLIVAALTLGLVLFVMNLLADAALIDAVNRLERGGVYRFSYSFSTALDMFFKFLGLALLAMFAAIAFFGLLVLFGALAFYLHKAIGVLYVLIAIPIVIIGIFLLYSLLELSKRAIVVRRVSIGDGIEEALRLLKRNLSATVILVLIIIGLSIGLSIAMTIVWLMANLPISTVIVALGYGFVPALIAAIIMGLPISLVAGGISGTFFSALITKFYFELVEPTSQTTAIPPTAPSPTA